MYVLFLHAVYCTVLFVVLSCVKFGRKLKPLIRDAEGNNTGGLSILLTCTFVNLIYLRKYFSLFYCDFLC